ncbi:MAG: bifunctional demethylmenaquinone methyltransferase/2-methoxy-6-polyprenyl-1,4-benzoquinol methylase UbiE [Candidatus Nitronauta litoralis]|uniref:Demethylmenaquinone methyltransferase n=1 Tax=Candidatus Nitronauta litoralis TaxID=2705533 RepID=A0A7T0BZG5_9BACT|nr:MAG: bifunctional demethylmenaquinone methyltransferase/2-methoxy-6-polyprenyl-1,4-benzoquinol methylase UbiE [Candidatus Nitronauta litoralis]
MKKNAEKPELISANQIVSQKAHNIQWMFNSIAHRYDLLNRLLSGGMDIRWRRKMVRKLAPVEGESILDLATGTADVALEILHQTRGHLNRLIGLDFSPAMLALAKDKLSATAATPTQIALAAGAAESIPISDSQFDGLTVAFGVRNYADLDRGLTEMARVLKPGGRAIILEFSLPRSRILCFGYKLYFKKILPLLGGLISGQPDAYQYLPDSVETFPVRNALREKLLAAGFESVEYKDMSLGIVTLYQAFKSESNQPFSQ